MNTSCKNCIFENMDNKECFFDLIDLIKDHKKISKIDNSNYIENYGCRYCMSRDTYDEIKLNEEYKNIDIIDMIVSKARIQYYLVVNLKNHVDQIEKICEIITNVDNKPEFISFINYNQDIGKDLSKKIDSLLLDKNIRWKLHNMLVDLSLQESMTIAMDTNIARTGLGVFYVYDPNISGLDQNTLNQRINFIHTTTIIRQKPCHVFLSNFDNIDGLSMSFHGFKFLILNICRDVLKAIQNEKDMIYLTYES